MMLALAEKCFAKDDFFGWNLLNFGKNLPVDSSDVNIQI